MGLKNIHKVVDEMIEAANPLAGYNFSIQKGLDHLKYERFLEPQTENSFTANGTAFLKIVNTYPEDEIRIVHGLCDLGQGLVGHSWLEAEGYAMDFSKEKFKAWPIIPFYSVLRVDKLIKYNFKDYYRNAKSVGFNHGPFESEFHSEEINYA